MTERVWLQSYPANIPADIDISGYGSVLDFFDETIRKYADKPAFSNFGKHLSFAGLDALSQQFASYLQTLGTLDKGDRVAVMMVNVPQFLIAVAGIFRIGAILVNVNPLYTAPELEHQLTDAGAKVVVAPCHNCIDQLMELNKEYKLGVSVKTVAELLSDAIVLPKR